jgi:Prealbumin-like fold domain
VTFTSPTAGTVTAHASFSITLGGVTLSRATDGKAPNSGDAVKMFVAGSVAWTKVDNAGVKQGGATFQVCKTHNYNLITNVMDDITDACFNVVDNAAPDTDADAGEFLVAGLSLGRYTVHETVAPAGFDLDPDTESVDLVPGNSSKTIATSFVNMRPVLKITGFGYTNAATGTPTSGVVSGTVVYTFDLKNYGNGPAVLSGSSLVVNSNATCPGGNTLAITGTIAAGASLGATSLTCTYTNLADNSVVSATLTVKTLTNGLARDASGSPATISYTVSAE